MYYYQFYIFCWQIPYGMILLLQHELSPVSRETALLPICQVALISCLEISVWHSAVPGISLTVWSSRGNKKLIGSTKKMIPKHNKNITVFYFISCIYGIFCCLKVQRKVPVQLCWQPQPGRHNPLLVWDSSLYCWEMATTCREIHHPKNYFKKQNHRCYGSNSIFKIYRRVCYYREEFVYAKNFLSLMRKWVHAYKT